jgi:hypothetical protein
MRKLAHAIGTFIVTQIVTRHSLVIFSRMAQRGAHQKCRGLEASRKSELLFEVR